jgi:hypothetical protein
MSERLTPETDAMVETDAHRIEEYSAPLTAYIRICELARTLERERDECRGKAVDLHSRASTLERELAALKSQFTKLDKPKYSGAPMMDSVLATRNPEFDAWVASLPATYWTRYDLSAARIGWEAARS